jgi:hypothetical protein
VACGVNPEDITVAKTCGLDEVNTVAKIKKFVTTLFAHELAALEAPEMLKLLAYRLKGPNDTEWNDINTPRQLTEEIAHLTKADMGVIRLQVCVLQEDDMDLNRPLMSGRAGKNLKGEEITVNYGQAGAESERNRRLDATKTSMSTQLRRLQDECKRAKREAQAANASLRSTQKELRGANASLRRTERILEDTRKDLKDTMGFLARSLEVMAGTAGEDSEEGDDEDEEASTILVSEAGEDANEEMRRVTRAVDALAS